MSRTPLYILAIAICSLRSTTAADMPRKVVLIMADDIGIECFGSYGGIDYKTPHIDKLAATGLRFTHASTRSRCAPRRAWRS